MKKIIILGTTNIDKLSLCKKLELHDDNLSITPKFTSDKFYEGKTLEHIYYMSIEDVCLGYKNNSFVYVNTNEDNISVGITLDDLYNNNIIDLSIQDFNKISDNTLMNNDILIIWLDTKYHDNIDISKDLNETKYLLDRLNSYEYLYFLDESLDVIVNVILNYINNEANRPLLLETYS